MANDKRTGLSGAINEFIARRAIPGEMEQNLVKEAVHLHLLSALSEAGVLQHVVFQGGTALRLCYGGERYSEDLDFVCGTAGAYVEKIEFGKLIREALETAKASLGRSFGIDLDQITLKQPDRPMAIKDSSIAVVAWQIVVPILSTCPRTMLLQKLREPHPAWFRFRTSSSASRAPTKFFPTRPLP